MTRFLVIISAEVEANDAQEAYEILMRDPRRGAKVWTVPKSIDDDPQLTEIEPNQRYFLEHLDGIEHTKE